jgi:hypothetical protein
MAGLTRTDEVTSSDLFTVFKYNDSDYRAAPASAVVSYIQGALTFPGDYTTQYSAPSATGFTVAITTGSNDIHLILTPLAGYATGTLTLPLASTCVDGQRVMVNSTQAVTTLTVGTNGAAGAVGAPTTLAANAFFTLKYDKPSNNWYRVG